MVRSEPKLLWRKRGSGYLPPLPNADSPLTTATTKLLDLHYSNKRIAERWTWERYQRLCSFLKVTEAELASLCLMPHGWIPKLKESNMLPCSVNGGGRAVGMILTLLEARVLKKLVPDVVAHPFPNLNNTLKRRAPLPRQTHQAAAGVAGQTGTAETPRLTG